MTATEAPADREPALRVALVGPAPDGHGGIGRVMSYVLPALPHQVRVRVLDTRGTATNPMFSLLPLLRTCVVLLALGALRRIDVAHVNISAHGSAVRKAAVVGICHLARVPTVLHLHASSFPEFYDGLPTVGRSIIRWVFGVPVGVVVLGDAWRDYVCDVLRVPPARVTVLPNAVPGPRHVVLRPRATAEPLRVLFLGRLGERKGVPELLGALADDRLADACWQATVAGDGDVERYRSHAATLGLAARVDFPGWVDAQQAHRLLVNAHVLVLPSHAEGLPLSVLEAFANGVPVVSTPVGSIPEVLTHGVEGLLVPTGRADRIADALAALLRDETWRVGLAAGARRRWERGHAIDGYVERLTDRWYQAADRSRRRAVPSDRSRRGPVPSDRHEKVGR